MVDAVPHELYIGGKWQAGSKGTLAVEDPSTGERLTDIADASVEDAVSALDAAVDAQHDWAKFPRANVARSYAGRMG